MQLGLSLTRAVPCAEHFRGYKSIHKRQWPQLPQPLHCWQHAAGEVAEVAVATQQAARACQQVQTLPPARR